MQRKDFLLLMNQNRRNDGATVIDPSIQLAKLQGEIQTSTAKLNDLHHFRAYQAIREEDKVACDVGIKTRTKGLHNCILKIRQNEHALAGAVTEYGAAQKTNKGGYLEWIQRHIMTYARAAGNHISITDAARLAPCAVEDPYNEKIRALLGSNHQDFLRVTADQRQWINDIEQSMGQLKSLHERNEANKTT